MSEYERSSYVSETGKKDENILESLLIAAEFRLEALRKQKELIMGKPSEASIEAQINVELKKLEQLRSKLSEQKSSN